MKPIRWMLVLGLLQSAALLATAELTGSPNDPLVIVQALYKADLKHFGFNAKTLKADRPYLAPDLYARLLKKANQPVAPGDALDVEGDVIFNAQDTPTKYTVGKGTVDQTRANVGVDLLWDKEKRHYTVFLKQFNGAWRVTEIDYGKDGKLSDLFE